ncbi:hypothetical protein E3U55_10325 [Filobacillus milosensis]|uniref:Uncharacterized protein n=1 Tax=Filobacillus milosensis TaxID=94137 RepID=A0A4Y8IFV3_9BACI|nr:hypothetical protein [Filobacillus milosensis]TFB19549.1 hypothetical protein E3U55_10325 [Filobacillus milosensis]
METLTRILPSLFIGITMIIAALILAPAIQDFSVVIESNSQEEEPENRLLNVEEVSNILDIEENELKEMIVKDQVERNQRTSYNTYQYIPSIKINNEFLFLEDELYKWLEYHSGRLQHQYGS